MHSLFHIWYLIPLGAIGLFRWACWIIRRIPASFYKPYVSEYREYMTVVTPVYQEDPEIFTIALDSWLANKWVSKVNCVIDVTDKRCMAIAYAHTDPRVNVIEIDIPGKRPSLVAGWEAADTELVALVDSDVIWAADVSDRVCEPFADDRIWGVGTRQNVYNPKTFLERVTDFFLDYRYFDENAAQTVAGRAVSCLSGRTAVYRRWYLVAAKEEFMAETFAGIPCNSGDDKRLTSLLLEAGGLTYMQRNARVWSTFPADLKTFWKQRLRWARNTWRSDVRALRRRWVFRYPFLAFVIIDRSISGFTLLLSPIFMAIAISKGHWQVVAVLATWWLLSRGMKQLPHLRRKPQDIILLPGYVGVTFFMAIIKIWALFTIRTQRWLTRKVAVVDGVIQRVDEGEDGETLVHTDEDADELPSTNGGPSTAGAGA